MSPDSIACYVKDGRERGAPTDRRELSISIKDSHSSV
jgi:hypothetical protein